MKRIILKILNSVAGFFNKMSDQEAKRIIEMHQQIFKVKPNKQKK
jgi:hypothetical protein